MIIDNDRIPDDVASLYRDSLPVLAREPRLRGVMTEAILAITQTTLISRVWLNSETAA